MTEYKSMVSRATALAVLCAVLFGVFTASALANFREEGCPPGDLGPCLADNSFHEVFFYLGPRLAAATQRTLTQSYDTTDLTISRTTDHAQADVAYGVQDLPGSIGLYECVAWVAGNRCDHAHVYYDGPEVANYSDSDLQALACHETGHSVGLLHPADEGQPNNPRDFFCMIQGGYPGKPRFLGPHNTGHIQANYN